MFGIQMEHQKKSFEDGWDSLSDSSQQTIATTACPKKLQGLAILHNQYSLQPDMITGWMPKLPSCPIPLTYQNKYIDYLAAQIVREHKYEIVYRGERAINSVQLHQKYNYKWKYRQRYDVKIKAIQQAIQNIGAQQSNQSIFDKQKKSSLDAKGACSLDFKSYQTNIQGYPTINLQDYCYSETPGHSYLNKNGSNQTEGDQYVFDSGMESGNLDMVVRVKPDEYDCFIRSDTNTLGHTNWYYFKVSNRKHKGVLQLNICNLIKQRNLYGKGMTPYTRVVYQSQYKNRKQQQKKGNSEQWQQNGCFQVRFVQRLCRYGSELKMNQLQFKFNFNEQNMQVYFAYSIPYTLTKLQSFIKQINRHPLVRVSTLCQSFSGLQLPLITIQGPYRQKQGNGKNRKKNIVVTARIHPGETNSSHMLQGFIRGLLEDNQSCQKMLQCCCFYIVPMVNPDGVVAGNYRTSFSGRDLNRMFSQVGSFLYPEINGLVGLVRRIKQQHKKVQFFLDLHSHSSKKDLFCYGPQLPSSSPYFLRARVLVKLLRMAHPMFNDKKCIFAVHEHKRNTGRAYMLQKQRIPMTFTFQVSNALYRSHSDTQNSFDSQSLQQAGTVLLQGLTHYFNCYFKDQPKQHPLRNHSEPRLSVDLRRRGSHELSRPKNMKRKTVMLSGSVQLQASNGQIEVKGIIDQILNEKDKSLATPQDQSDNQSVEHDMKDSQLQKLFDRRSLKPQKTKQKLQRNSKSKQKTTEKTQKGQRQKTEKCLQGISSKYLQEISSKHLILKKNSRPSSSKWMRGKQVVRQKLQIERGRESKTRIYYQDTHPANFKKIGDNVILTKKALKQKRFPILF